MITAIPDFLSEEDSARIASDLMAANFADGLASAGWHAREVKKNLQLVAGMPGYEQPDKVVRGAIVRSAILQMAVRPRFLHPIVFNRYDETMAYGRHVDDAVMAVPGGSPGQMRTDVSFTLFLSGPDSYGGGELVIDSGGVEHGFKPPRGTLIAYPSNTLHRVEPVTNGTRLAAIGWIQSEVRAAEHRAILFDLDMARRAVFARDGKSATFDLLSKSHSNLLRLWVES